MLGLHAPGGRGVDVKRHRPFGLTISLLYFLLVTLMVYCILLKSIEMKVEKPQAAFAYYFYVLLLGMTEDISRAG